MRVFFTVSISLFYLSICHAKFLNFQKISIKDEFTRDCYKNCISISIVLVEGEWKKEMILKRFTKLQKVYRQCSIEVGIKEFYKVKWIYPGDGLFFDLLNEQEYSFFDGAQQLLLDLNLKKRPLAIFIDSFDHEINKIATSIPRVATRLELVSLNTLWITNKVNDKEYLEKEPDSYSVFAHELGHVLLNEGHTFVEPNLMHYKLEMLNGTLTEAQCAKISENISMFQ